MEGLRDELLDGGVEEWIDIWMPMTDGRMY